MNVKGSRWEVSSATPTAFELEPRICGVVARVDHETSGDEAPTEQQQAAHSTPVPR